MRNAFPFMRDLVLVGGGHAHALVMRMWGMDPLPGTRLTLISPDPVTPYTGMLPGLIAGHYQRSDLMIDLVRLARFAGARFVIDRATAIDPGDRLIHLSGRAPLPYDIVSIDVGIASDLPDLPGALHAIAAKPLGDYAASWESFVARGLTSPQVVIVGAGLGGIELALASAHRLRSSGALPSLTLIDRSEDLLGGLGSSAKRTVMAQLAADGIRLRLGVDVTEIGAAGVTLSNGETIKSDFTLTVTGARAQSWLSEIGLAQERGFLVTNDHLQTSIPNIFAAGDCATVSGQPRPKAGVFAVRAAPVLFANLRASLSGQSLRRFRPQRDYLKLVALGSKVGVADKWGFSLHGRRLWVLKDRIDRRFMQRLTDLPQMARPALPKVRTEGLEAHLTRRPLCGGCGAKLGPGSLSAALSGLPAPSLPEVVSGRGDDAAVLRTGKGVQVLTTDHLRSFSDDTVLMSRLTALHALGDIWAMGATPQVALAQITLPPMGPDLQTRTLAEIMSEAAAVFREAGADIVGGHSTEGAELTIGFTVTGTAVRAIGKDGAQEGDALILTKPIGSGTILAAEMAMANLPGLILGEIWAACIEQMSRNQGSAAAMLLAQANAMTDVTGFGLAGHLLEMLTASNRSAVVRLADVPLLPGALYLAEAGFGSSLQPANLAAVSGRVTGLFGARAELLADPQTSGGLLASVPVEKADGLLDRLRAAGHAAAVIGTVTAGAPHLKVV